MRKVLIQFGLCWSVLHLGAAAWAQTPCQLTTTSSSPSNAPAGSFITLTATPSGTCPTIVSVSFYAVFNVSAAQTLLGVAGNSPYTLQWDTAGLPAGSYSITARASFAASVGSGPTTTMDIVGSPKTGLAANVLNPTSNAVFGYGNAGSWLEGDSQMCMVNWPYNGSPGANFSQGTCAWDDTGALNPNTVPSISGNSTIDSLDDTMHALSDFSVFARVMLNKNTGALSNDVQSWYPQAASWVSATCDDGSACTNNVCGDGTICNRLGGVVNNLNAWQPVVQQWLNINSYADASVWCLPPGGTGSTPGTMNAANEDAYINSHDQACADGSACTSNACADGTSCGVWGGLPSVAACESYNSGFNGDGTAIAPACAAGTLANNTCVTTSGGTSTVVGYPTGSPVYNYTQCQAWLNFNCANFACDDNSACTGGQCADGTSCLSSVSGTPCDPANLGRTLTLTAPPNFDGCSGTYAQWVQDSLTLANDEAPKFLKRAQFLNDVYNRAAAMQKIFSQGSLAIQNFLNGPAALLPNALTYNQGVGALPNSVVYGWQDGLPPGGSGGCLDSATNRRVGCTHLVKVTAYATGRCQGPNAGRSYCSDPGIEPKLPWIKTKTSGFLSTTRSYTLTNRDGWVYVSVKRWDQNHTNPVAFPNGRPLWQGRYSNPLGANTAGVGFADCTGLAAPLSSSVSQIGFGITPTTVSGLEFMASQAPSQVTTDDATALSQAFMLNDRGDGLTDSSVLLNKATYGGCLSEVNQLLQNAPESHACAQYVASLNAAGSSSGNGDQDYSIKFVDCSTLPRGIPPDDLQ